MKKTLFFLVMVLAPATASAFQTDYNKPEFGYIPYHQLLLDVTRDVSGVDPRSLPGQVRAAVVRPTTGNLVSVPPTTVQTLSMHSLVTSAYRTFADNAWSYHTDQRTYTTGKWWRKTIHYLLQVRGSNAFTGESYQSGYVEVASQKKSLLGLILGIVGSGAVAAVILL